MIVIEDVSGRINICHPDGRVVGRALANASIPRSRARANAELWALAPELARLLHWTVEQLKNRTDGAIDREKLDKAEDLVTRALRWEREKE